MPPTESTTTRVGADGEPVEPGTQKQEVVEAKVPGDNPDNFVVITLAHPLNEKDRVYLGLPKDASTEVGQKVKVNKNGAQSIINAGYATVDPEDNTAVRAALRGESPQEGEPTSEPEAEARTTPADNPPQAESTPGADGQPTPPLAAEAQQAAQGGESGGKSGKQSGGQSGATPGAGR